MVTISFETGNAALRNEDGTLDLNEVSDVIKEVADAIILGVTEGFPRDFNGNVIGWYKLED